MADTLMDGTLRRVVDETRRRDADAGDIVAKAHRVARTVDRLRTSTTRAWALVEEARKRLQEGRDTVPTMALLQQAADLLADTHE